MRSWATVLLVAIAVLAQVAVVNRLPLPWGICPDVVVLAVTAVTLGSTPAAGAVTGFAAGVAVDVLPPADHEIGRYALLLCVVGYLVGSVRDSRAHPLAWPFGVAAVATLGVALGSAAIGLVTGDPRVSPGSAAVSVPATVALTMLVSPLVLLPVRRIRRSLARSVDDLSTMTGRPWVSGGLRG